MPGRSPPPQWRYVYVIGPAEGLQKVGLATDPRVRLATLQTAVPSNLVLHAAVRVPFAQTHAVERRAHKLLADVCARNEWFHCTPEEAIAAVQEAAIPPKPVPPERRPANVLAGALPMSPIGGDLQAHQSFASACGFSHRNHLIFVAITCDAF